jgi:pimeloyl-ACP methyl ester carboxylesterase
VWRKITIRLARITVAMPGKTFELMAALKEAASVAKSVQRASACIAETCADGRVWMKPEGIACFAGDLSAEEQGVVYATHFAPAVDLFNQKHDGIAWRSKPSWSIVATEDRTVHPDLERFAAKRMGATTVELRSSHVPTLSQPHAVLDVIRNAAKAVAAKHGKAA